MADGATFVLPAAPLARVYEAFAHAVMEAHAAGEMSDEAAVAVARTLKADVEKLTGGTVRV